MANVNLGADVHESTDIPGLPRPPVYFIERARLNTRLDELVAGESQIVAVWGAAGSGKTSLLANWAAQLIDASHEVIWLTPTDVATSSRALERVRDHWRRTDASADSNSELFI